MTVPHSYAPSGPSATTTLVDDLLSKIASQGPISFSDFMASALYDPIRGYYARETRQVGKQGDFFTSVSIGPLFGALLATRFVTWWEENDRPTAWQIQEAGAHDGTLAADILRAIQETKPCAFQSLEYRIVEPLPLLASAQRKTLEPYMDRVKISSTADEQSPLPGVIFGNELLDALPFHLIEWTENQWMECRVNKKNNRFKFQLNRLIDPSFDLPHGSFPDAYRTEVRSCYEEILRPKLASLTHGLMIWIDYGFAHPDYYTPERSSGTLRTFYRHQAGEDPLENPGEQDITAHVDFTAVAKAGLALGAVPLEFCDQGTWLTRLAGPWLKSLEGNPSPISIRQFQTLTHPAHLGARFQVLELSFGEPVDENRRQRAIHRLALEQAP